MSTCLLTVQPSRRNSGSSRAPAASSRSSSLRCCSPAAPWIRSASAASSAAATPSGRLLDQEVVRVPSPRQPLVEQRRAVGEGLFPRASVICEREEPERALELSHRAQLPLEERALGAAESTASIVLEQLERAGLVERLVQVAALGRLDARRAAVLARAAGEQLRRVARPSPRRRRSRARRSRRRRSGRRRRRPSAGRSGSGRWSRARRCPSGRTSPTAAGSRSSRARPRAAFRAGAASGPTRRAASASGRYQTASVSKVVSGRSSGDEVDRLAAADRPPLVGDHLLGHRDPPERQLEPQPLLGSERLVDLRVRLLLRLRVPVARERLDERGARRRGRARAPGRSRPGGGRSRPGGRSSRPARARRGRASSRCRRRRP